MAKTKGQPCTVCGVSVYAKSGRAHNVADDQPHTCGDPTATTSEKRPERHGGATCASCGLRSRSPMIVKQLDGDRGRCVNAAACERRQTLAAKRQGVAP